ncbi:hypothetical protein DPMN_097076 [Dreissena polymorpha]|uniref:Uncharacterized protein n=1 Tax=Dreissena polymorpha TaxID=45954 RepID=A0A9D4R535_DREPO|nr:hypothetical protein DPMN_097076 [Dreissena polymorpha]
MYTHNWYKLSLQNPALTIQLLVYFPYFRKERERCHSQASESSQTSAPTPTKSLLEHSASVCEITEARLAEVTQQDRLDMLVSLYSKCLEGM